MFDVHVHASPDVVPRIGDDTAVAQTYQEAGFDGFVLKAHHESTVGRAAAVARAGSLDVVGGVALNRNVGGINPAAVAACLYAGGRLVWFPTADAHTQEAAGLPRLADVDQRIGRPALCVPPVHHPTAAELDDTALVLDLIADFDAVLATGHLSASECAWLLDQAQYRGIRRVLLTHPSYTVPGMTVDDIRAFAARGAHVEITAYQLWHQPEMTESHLAAVARAAGDRLVLASDAGQTDSPPPPEALTTLVERLARQGLDRAWLSAAAGDVPRSLVLRD
ncbi:MAG TPA: DUF6282 family protein [Nocardioidaceae bacterium]|nr:DUF6282 family protein [Nocardioidaceae bacterium]